MNPRAHGTLSVRVNGDALILKGEFSYALGLPQRESILGPNGVVGYTEKATAAFIEGEIVIDGSMETEKILQIIDADVILNLKSGKSVILNDCWNETEGVVSVEEGSLQVKFVSPHKGIESRQ